MGKITLILIGLFFLNTNITFGQSQSDSIQIKRNFGTVFIQNGKKLTPKKLLDITKSNSEAYKEMKIAKSNFDIGTVIGVCGGILVGFPIGTALGGGEPNWALAGVGAGLIVISIPFTTSYTKHAKKAVGIYNNGGSLTGFRKINFDLGITSNGLGIKMVF
jgi:hypothetical protein